MSCELPEALQDVVTRLSRLPGMGPKSALRVAMTLLSWPEALTRELGTSIVQLRDKLHLCNRCGGLSQAVTCPLCSDPTRSQETLCIVTDWDSELTLERGGFYQGQYLVLGGLISPLENSSAGQYLVLGGLISPLENSSADKLNLDLLDKRLAEGLVSEVIFALGATLEAENTASFLQGLINSRFPNVRVTRLAQGIPLGSEVKNMDMETLRQSLKYRQDLR